MTISLSARFSPTTNGLKITEANEIRLCTLRDILAGEKGEDPYLLSPAYLRMTGRRGMDIIRLRDTFSFVCRHPNEPSKDMMFYPYGPEKSDLIVNYCLEVNHSGSRIPHIGRVPAALANNLVDDVNSRLPVGRHFQIAEEQVLDWRYPVHTLSTHQVAAAEGHDFKDFRKNLSRAGRLGLSAQKFDRDRTPQQITQIAMGWSHAHAATYQKPAHELAELYYWLGASMHQGMVDVDGYVVNKDNQPAAFVAWEKPQPGQKTVSSLASLSTVKDKGVNEYLYMLMCRDLSTQGVDQVCIGGSETSGLDAFKRKMQPVSSTKMVTLVPDQIL
jgi:hypothetical protein